MQGLFDEAKAVEPVDTPLQRLLLDGFTAEQVWAQLELLRGNVQPMLGEAAARAMAAREEIVRSVGEAAQLGASSSSDGDSASEGEESEASGGAGAAKAAVGSKRGSSDESESESESESEGDSEGEGEAGGRGRGGGAGRKRQKGGRRSAADDDFFKMADMEAFLEAEERR